MSLDPPCGNNTLNINTPTSVPPPVKHDKANNKDLQFSSIALYNMRSLLPKISNVILDFKMRLCDLFCLTEVWSLDKCKENDENALISMDELDGIDIVYSTRSEKKGGGVAIMCKKETYSMKKANIEIPKGIEILWIVASSKMPKCDFKILVGVFYSPPLQGKNVKLVEHISDVIHTQLTKFPSLPILVLGDKNKIDMNSLCKIDPSFSQIVTKPTRGKNILDIILLNTPKRYFSPLIVPPILPDHPDHGVPSDTQGVIIHPKS